MTNVGGGVSALLRRNMHVQGVPLLSADEVGYTFSPDSTTTSLKGSP